ncbi:Uncharacterised protein [Segatella copri]|nr:Uncharacterised protein [Segatella copri]
MVATIPVPASPSGGQSGVPAWSVPDGSSFFAPSSVNTPASSPAFSTSGRMSRIFQPRFLGSMSLSNLATISAS